MSPRTGRRSGASGTREAILHAARQRFAAHGYDGATIRAIAADAGVDPALVLHFYGAKEKLFAAALDLPVDPAAIAAVLVHGGPRDQLGERMIRLFLTLWGDAGSGAPFLALIRSATSNEQAAAAFRGFVGRALLSRIAEPLGVPRLRFEAAVAQMVGVALMRYVVGIEPIASVSDEELVALLGPQLQRILDGA